MPLPTPYAYVVSYDLKQPPNMYTPLFNELRQSLKWWHYLTATWIVLRHETLVEFQSKLNPLIFQTDRLLIMPAKGPAAGWLPPDAWKWIQENVPREW
jgi:hypothetical protein